MSFGAATVVEGIPRVGLPFGLFSVVAFQRANDRRWENGVEWEALPCVPAFLYEETECADPHPYKSFEPAGNIGSAVPFVAYGGTTCTGPPRPEDLETASTLLLAREEGAAERHYWNQMFASATTTGVAGSVSPAVGLALLEQWIGSSYGSLGVIHMARRTASVLGTTHLTPTGPQLLTGLGTPVVAGAGYAGLRPEDIGGPDPYNPATDLWMLAAPAPFGYRSEVFTNAVFDHGTNDHLALAERRYVLAHDPCPILAVKVTSA